MAGFTFCQPSLPLATIDWMRTTTAAENEAIRTSTHWGVCARLYRYRLLNSNLLPPGHSPGDRRPIRLDCHDHEQTLTLRSATGSNSGDAVALMGTDTTRTTASMRSLHEIWASLISIVIAIWLLENQVYVACVLPAVIAVGYILATGPVFTRCGDAQKKWVGHVQERLAVTTAMLRDMKAVKILGLKAGN